MVRDWPAGAFSALLNTGSRANLHVIPLSAGTLAKYTPKKRTFRALWIQRINAAARANDMTYNRFIQGLKAAEIEVDRRMLAELAVNDEAAFAVLVEVARAAVPAQSA